MSDTEREYVIVRSFTEFEPCDFVVHPVIGGWKVARGWQPGYEAQVRADERERIAAAIEAAHATANHCDCTYAVAARIARAEPTDSEES